MKCKSTITPSQLVLVTLGSALLYPYTFTPILNSPPANQDVWISLFFALFYIMILSIPILILSNRFRGISVVETFDIIAGKVISKIFLFMFVAFFIFCFIACMVMMLLFIRIYIMHNTPDWAVMLYMLIPVAYGAYKGAGVIARISWIIVPLMVLSVIMFFLLAIPDIDINIIRPVLADSTLAELNLGGFLTAARYSDILIFYVFSYFLCKNASINKAYFAGLGLFGLTFFLILMSILLILGSDVAKLEWNPYYVFSRQIESYDFLKRLHSINLLTWFPGAMLKLMVYSYMTGHIMQGVFKTKSHRPYSLAVVLIAFLIALFPFINNMPFISYLRSDEVFPFIVLPVLFIVPLILLIIYLVKKKKIDNIVKDRQQK